MLSSAAGGCPSSSASTSSHTQQPTFPTDSPDRLLLLALVMLLQPFAVLCLRYMRYHHLVSPPPPKPASPTSTRAGAVTSARSPNTPKSTINFCHCPASYWFNAVVLLIGLIFVISSWTLMAGLTIEGFYYPWTTSFFFSGALFINVLFCVISGGADTPLKSKYSVLNITATCAMFLGTIALQQVRFVKSIADMPRNSWIFTAIVGAFALGLQVGITCWQYRPPTARSRSPSTYAGSGDPDSPRMAVDRANSSLFYCSSKRVFFLSKRFARPVLTGMVQAQTLIFMKKFMLTVMSGQDISTAVSLSLTSLVIIFGAFTIFHLSKCLKEFRNLPEDVMLIFTIHYALSCMLSAIFEFSFHPLCTTVDKARAPFAVGLLLNVAGIAGLIHNYDQKLQRAASVKQEDLNASFGPSPLQINPSNSIRLFFPPVDLPDSDSDDHHPVETEVLERIPTDEAAVGGHWGSSSDSLNKDDEIDFVDAAATASEPTKTTSVITSSNSNNKEVVLKSATFSTLP